MSKILKCKKCGDIIQSKHRHNMVWCKCHSVAIDGGDDYCRWAGDKENIEFYIEESRFQTHKETDAKTIQEQSDLIEQLKQQLAEKDDEIEEYKIMHWNMQKQHLDFIKELDQDKISFAVEQLEKVKKYIDEDKVYYIDDYGETWVLEANLLIEIDNQIKQLKEGK